MKYKNNICDGCDHACFNNEDDGLRMGCRAFPDGIDTHVIGSLHTHDKPIEGQKNDYVYMPAKRKVDLAGNKIEIFQDSNPYADENGRYNGK